MVKNSPFSAPAAALILPLALASAPALAQTSDVKEDSVVFQPDKVADELIAFRERVGDFGTLLYAGKDWRDPELARRSMVLLAEKVLPKVNAAPAPKVKTA